MHNNKNVHFMLSAPSLIRSCVYEESEIRFWLNKNMCLVFLFLINEIQTKSCELSFETSVLFVVTYSQCAIKKNWLRIYENKLKLTAPAMTWFPFLNSCPWTSFIYLRATIKFFFLLIFVDRNKNILSYNFHKLSYM